MTGFEKYQHVERWNHQECEGLLDGVCYIFYKIDGTNASVWWDGAPKAGSRNRLLSLDNDNANFYSWVCAQDNLFFFLEKYPHLRLFGEWLVPHTLKTYREDAWNRFYIFDVQDTRNGELLSYEAYKPLLDEFGIDYIPPMCIIRNPNEEDLYKLIDKTGQFLVKNGEGNGEGFVIKNYDYQNKYGRQVWGKLVTNEFKAQNHKVMGPPIIHSGMMIEEKIVEVYLTEEFIKKEQAKIILNHSNEAIWKDYGASYEFDGWTNKMIPELLERVWYEFIREEMTEILKKEKDPKINFRLLRQMVLNKTKKVIGL